MPVLGVFALEQDLNLTRKSVRGRDGNRGTERESRARRGRRYRSTSYDSRPRSTSATRLRSDSVASTMSRRGRNRSQSHRSGGKNFTQQNLPSLKNLRKQLRNQYNDKIMLVVARYIDEMELNAEIVNNINYLRRCRDLGIIPKEYWMINASVRNTREVVRILDDCSYRLMCHDQQYYTLRKSQLAKQLTRTEDQLEKLLSMQDYQRLCAVVKTHRNDLFSRIRDEQRKAVECLRKEVEDYQSYLREKKKPRRTGDGTVANGGSGRRVRHRNKEGRMKDDMEAGERPKSEDAALAVSVHDDVHNKESKDSDGEDGSVHRVQRRTTGSASSHEDGSNLSDD